MKKTPRIERKKAERSRTAAELFVECLEEEGVRCVFGVPGEENLHVLDALRKSSIRFIVTRHEQAAAFMAATYGRLTGHAGVALATLGPGATNTLTGIAFAQLGGMPLVMVTGQKPIKTSKQAAFQIIDIVGMMKPVTKRATTIVSAGKIPSVVREAFKVAEAERPGAVHIEFPEDIAGEEIAPSLVPLSRIMVRRAGPDPKAIEAAVAMIEEAKRPLLIVAAGANRKLVCKHLVKFIEKTGIPFVSTQMGKGVIDERSEKYIGTTALSGSEYAHCAIDAADLVIVIGHDVTEKPPALLKEGAKKIIHINFYSADVDDLYAPTHEIVGDISHSLWAMTDTIIPSSKWDFSYFKKLAAVSGESLQESAGSSAFPLKPQRIVADIRTAMPDNGIVSLDNGMFKLWFARNYRAYGQNTLLLDNALATMGAGLPGAVAAKIAFPERSVIAVAGDGGFMMSLPDLETAVRLKLDLAVIIIKDNAYGMIEWKQQSMGMKPFGLTFTNPDFVALAASFGARGHRVHNASELALLLKSALTEGGIHLIECPIDYSENKKVFSESKSKKKKCML